MKVSTRITLWVILASATLTVGAGAIIAPVLNLMREGLSVDPTSVGLIITTHALFIAISSPLIGSLVDRIGIKKPFIAGLCLYGIAGGSGLFITSYWKLIISRAILGVSAAAILVPITVLILNLYKGGERNKIMGWRGSANSFGSIIWPLIGGFLGTFSWHFPFAVYLIGIPLGILVVFTISEPKKEKPQKAEKQSSLFKILKGNPILFIIYGLTFLSMILLYVIVIFLPQRLTEIGISNPFYISVFFSAMGVSTGVTSFMYGKIKLRFSYKMIVLTALATWAVGYIALSQAFTVLFIASSTILSGIGQGMMLPAVMVWAGEKVDITFRGRIISYLTTFMFIGQFSSPVIFGNVFTLTGLNGVFLIAGGVCAALFAMFAVTPEKIIH